MGKGGWSSRLVGAGAGGVGEILLRFGQERYRCSWRSGAVVGRFPDAVGGCSRWKGWNNVGSEE